MAAYRLCKDRFGGEFLHGDLVLEHFVDFPYPQQLQHFLQRGRCMSLPRFGFAKLPDQSAQKCYVAQPNLPHRQRGVLQSVMFVCFGRALLVSQDAMTSAERRLPLFPTKIYSAASV